MGKDGGGLTTLTQFLVLAWRQRRPQCNELYEVEEASARKRSLEACRRGGVQAFVGEEPTAMTDTITSVVRVSDSKRVR